MKLKTVLYSQRNPQWGSELLGFNTNSKFTIHDYGCLITCFGMYINKNPHEVNDILKANGGFTAGSGNFIWNKSSVLGLTQTYVSPNYTGPMTAQGLTKIKELLDQHLPLICEIDFNPATEGEEMHFVLLCGYSGDKLQVADPWTGQVIDLDVYGGPARAIIQFRAYNKTLEEEVDGQSIIIQHADNWLALLQRYNFSDNKDLVFAEIDKLPTLEDDVIKKDRELAEKSGMITNLAEKLSNERNENAGLRIEVDKIKNVLENKDMQYKEMQEELEKIKAIKPIDQYSKLELLTRLIFGNK